jgi:hypothetical protein
LLGENPAQRNGFAPDALDVESTRGHGGSSRAPLI